MIVTVTSGRNRRNIQRVDRHYFHGWHVCLKRAGQRNDKNFHDRGDRWAALARARRWRDATVARLPKPRKFHRTCVLNTTGEVGVHVAVQHTRKGTLVRYACATWIDDVGRQRKRSFSIAKYGEHRALSLAIDTRRRVVAELLRPPGLS